MTSRSERSVLRALPSLVRQPLYGPNPARDAAKDILRLTNEARDTLPLTRLTAFSAWIRRLHLPLASPIFPRSPKDIRLQPLLNEQALPREIAFALGSLRPLARDLREFRALEVAMYAAHSDGKAEDALRLLLDAERRFGFSVWAATCALLWLQEARGTETQKACLHKILKAERATGLIRYLSHYASMRAEPAASAASYEDAAVRAAGSLLAQLPGPWVSVVSRHLMPCAEFPPGAVAASLAMEATGGAIDYYQGLKWALLHLCSIGDEQGALGPLVAEFAAETADEDLSRLSSALQATRSSDGGLLWYPSLMETAEASASFAQCWVGLTGAATGTPAGTPSPLTPGSANDPSREKLKKLAQQRSYCLNTSAVWLAVEAECREVESSRWNRTVTAVAGGIHAPASGIEPAWPPTAIGALDAAAWRWHKQPDDQLDLPTSEDGLGCDWRARRVRLIIDSLLHSSRLSEAIRTVCQHATAAPELIGALPLARIGKLLDKSNRRKLARQGPDLAVLLDMLCRHRGQRLETERRHAAEDFVIAQQCQRPSQLRTIDAISTVPKPILVHFLRDVCTEQGIDKFRCFRGAQEVAEERVEICRWIADLGDGEAVRAEIAGILRKMMIAEGMEKLQRSKVFVDLEGFRLAAGRRVRDQFDRFVALPVALADAGRTEAMDAAKKVVNEGKYDEFLALTLPKNERSALITKIVMTIRDEFVFTPPHGLDGYLSVRIRHGAVRNYLRAPFDGEALSTVKAEAGSEYEDNPSWVTFLGHLPPHAQPAAMAVLKRLAEQLDAEILKVNSRLQVRSSTEAAGLFDFSVPENAIAVLADYATLHPFETFVEQVELLLLAWLDRNLAAIREYARGEAKAALSAIVRTAIHDFEGPTFLMLDVSDVTGRLHRVHTSLLTTVEGLGDWFQRTPAIASEPFDIEDAVRIAAETVRRGPAGFGPTIRRSGDDASVIDGIYFQSLVDAFTLLMDNASRHSGQSAPQVDVSIEQNPDSVEFVVRNSVSEAAGATAMERLSTIRPKLSDPSHMAFVRREGGSGIYKLQKVLMHDLGVLPDLALEVSDGWFVVSFRISIRPKSVEAA